MVHERDQVIDDLVPDVLDHEDSFKEEEKRLFPLSTDSKGQDELKVPDKVSNAMSRRHRLYGGEEDEMKHSLKDITVRMDFHLELVDLLGICSKGKNFLAETFCQRVIPLDVSVS